MIWLMTALLLALAVLGPLFGADSRSRERARVVWTEERRERSDEGRRRVKRPRAATAKRAQSNT